MNWNFIAWSPDEFGEWHWSWSHYVSHSCCVLMNCREKNAGIRISFDELCDWNLIDFATLSWLHPCLSFDGYFSICAQSYGVNSIYILSKRFWGISHFRTYHGSNFGAKNLLSHLSLSHTTLEFLYLIWRQVFSFQDKRGEWVQQLKKYPKFIERERRVVVERD